jgi:hypothetical protein
MNDLGYRVNCYGTLLLGHSQITAIMTTTTTAITFIIKAYATQTKKQAKATVESAFYRYRSLSPYACS